MRQLTRNMLRKLIAENIATEQALAQPVSALLDACREMWINELSTGDEDGDGIVDLGETSDQQLDEVLDILRDNIMHEINETFDAIRRGVFSRF